MNNTLSCENCITRKLEALLKNICLIQGITIDQIKSKSRDRKILYTRHCFCKMAQFFYSASSSVIGLIINRGHCAVLNSIKQVEEVKEIRSFYDEIIAEMNI